MSAEICPRCDGETMTYVHEETCEHAGDWVRAWHRGMLLGPGSRCESCQTMYVRCPRCRGTGRVLVARASDHDGGHGEGGL